MSHEITGTMSDNVTMSDVVALIDSNENDQALPIINKILLDDPNNAYCHYLASLALQKTGSPLMARDAAEKAVQLNPNSATYLANFGWILSKVSRSSDKANGNIAINVCREAMRLRPDDLNLYIQFTTTLAHFNKLKEANSVIREAISIWPNEGKVWSQASYLAIKGGHIHGAETAAIYALMLDPTNSKALNNLGVVAKMRGKWKFAAVAYFQSANSDPNLEMAENNIEAIGVHHYSRLINLAFLPLLIFWPSYFAVRIMVSRYLKSHPEKLGPRAKEYGYRVATSKKNVAKYEAYVAKLKDHLENPNKLRSWNVFGKKNSLIFYASIFLTPFLINAIIIGAFSIYKATTVSSMLVAILMLFFGVMLLIACLYIILGLKNKFDKLHRESKSE